MDRAQARASIESHPAERRAAADVSDAAGDEADGTPLRQYLATLEPGNEGARLLRHIRVYLHKAGLGNALPGRDHSLEILHEAVVEALASEERFDPERSPSAWLWGIAVKVVLRHREKLFRRNKHESVTSDLTASDDPNPFGEEELFARLVALHQDGPEQEVLGTMSVDDLLAQLPPADRQIIELNVLHEMNGREVAQKLGISEGNARVRFHRALKKLKAIWLEQEAGREEKQNHE
ncbi:MAG: sigma-70 family RNA polymerase sigma factor [Caldilineaceae bacterium]|nr:sigma-70 family RNA polymerase sigma factor [Caldilineaceae bacterium]